MSTITAYPLQWPSGWKRTAPHQRTHGRFGKRERISHNPYPMLKNLSVAEATHRVLDALTKTAQVRMCGNSVCPPLARAIVAANFTEASAMRKAA